MIEGGEDPLFIARRLVVMASEDISLADPTAMMVAGEAARAFERLGEPEGLVKTIFDEKTGELLGAHMIGAEVTEMIQGYVVGKTAELTEAEFMHTVFPHPTLSEMMHESVLDAYGKAIHF